MTQADVPTGEFDDSDPAVAAALGLVPAGAGIRSLAFAIDVALWAIPAAVPVAGAVLLVTGTAPLVPIILLAAGGFLTTLFVVIQLIVHGRRGVTAGKAMLRLRSVSAVDYGPPGFWRVVLRALVLCVGNIAVLIGPAILFASALWDPQARGRSILDRVGGCWVVDTRAGIDPFDAKAMRHARRTLRGRPDDSEDLPSMATGVGAADALRILGARSRAGVVGSGSTGAQWAARDSAPVGVIDAVPDVSRPAPAEPSRDRVAAAPAVATSAAVAPPVAASPAVAPPAATPPVAAPPAAAEAVGSRRGRPTVRFDDGSTMRVPALALIGRDPEAAAGEHVDAIVQLDDPERLMSKTHAAFGQDADGVWIADRGSRNGTQLRSPGGDTVPVPVGEAMRVPLGWTVHVGGRTFDVVARGADS
ncbi:RDD family protein [Microbacterium sp. NPDC055910]|uniref:RDD family protein n=1 Tax=Microbacterium sp. NPDC055910 TaxID=3345659 RepID=UPI0035D5C629